MRRILRCRRNVMSAKVNPIKKTICQAHRAKDYLYCAFFRLAVLVAYGVSSSPWVCLLTKRGTRGYEFVSVFPYSAVVNSAFEIAGSWFCRSQHVFTKQSEQTNGTSRRESHRDAGHAAYNRDNGQFSLPFHSDQANLWSPVERACANGFTVETRILHVLAILVC